MFYVVYSLLLLDGFAVGCFASGICGNGIGGGMFSVREISTDSMNTTLDMDCTITGGGGFLSS